MLGRATRNDRLDRGSAVPWERVVGDNVRRLRKVKRVTQAQLAASANLDLRYLGSIERGDGNPSVAILGKLAEALGVHPSEFLYDGLQPPEGEG